MNLNGICLGDGIRDLLVIVSLVLVLLLLPSSGRCTLLLLMDDQPCPRLFFVPLEACQDGEFHFIIGLDRTVSMLERVDGISRVLTFFLNCLYMASSASFIVTPFRFRAVTSSPRGKWRSIFFTGGVVKNFFNASLSSNVAGEVLSFLFGKWSALFSNSDSLSRDCCR